MVDQAGMVIGAFSIMFIVIWLIFIAVMILSVVFWIWMLIDAANRKFKNHDEKVIWILVIALTGIIGAIIYYFMIKRKSA